MSAGFLSTEDLYKLFLSCDQAITTDSRKIVPGSIFFALKGPNFNANEFARHAIDRGAAYSVVDDPGVANGTDVFLVEEVLNSLQQLANYHRRQFKVPVLAITGSNGKTTSKELIRTVVSQKYNTLATEGNLNNHIGVPLTLLKLRGTHSFAIIEMGANHIGEIAQLCLIAEPDYGLITNIGKAHLDGFGGEEGVKKGKSELYLWLKDAGGQAFVNCDDDTLNNLAGNNQKISYGCKKLYDVIGKDCTTGDTVSLKYTTRYGDKNWSNIKTIETQIIGRYNFINCLAAVTVGIYFKVEPVLIEQALVNYVPDMNRSQLLNTGRNILILDAYNANPDSMKAAIENFSTYKAESKMVLLGDMFELGEYSLEEHQKVAEMLKKSHIGKVMLVGENFFGVEAPGFTKFKTTEECRNFLRDNSVEGQTILIKGSRSMKMESLKDVL